MMSMNISLPNLQVPWNTLAKGVIHSCETELCIKIFPGIASLPPQASNQADHACKSSCVASPFCIDIISR
jgi:hypothetical protein